MPHEPGHEAQSPEIQNILDALAAGIITPEEAQSELSRVGLGDAEIQGLITPDIALDPARAQEVVRNEATAPSDFPVGGPEPLDDVVARSSPVRDTEGAALELEQRPRDIFRGFTSGGFDPELGGLARQSQLNQFAPSNLSFLLGLDPEQFGPGGETGTGSFRDFLRGGGQALDPSQLQQGLGNLFQRVQGAPESGFAEFFQNAPGADRRLFDLANQAAQARTNPLFRRAFGNAAENRFTQFRERSPERSFLQFLEGRGGRV